MRREREGSITMLRSSLFSVLAALIGAAAASSAPAQSIATHLVSASADAPASRSASPFMREGDEVRGPSGYYALCARAPWDCPTPAPNETGHAARVALDGLTRSQLERVNRRMNHAYTAMTDEKLYGVSDLWAIPSSGADCEDYVLAKRAALVDAGWPAAALLIGVVRGESTPYHAVLIARTDRGELVLDNLTDEIRDWRDSGYEWIVRQSLEDPNRWVRVLDGAPSDARAGALQPATLPRDASRPSRNQRPNAQN